ncbi:pyridoxamine 5'-phosphate oxidase family protein [Anaerovorax odorimutans]|uniref:Pyridoxamine 5'-phosphate oxidase family protein n=1 Tax=Anaerovorax odorimutans TaxID=109327 RepID=A0ABT1RSK5_9FIRM|nr:pyridoxamine 5'-phosphate oxidase family protein [Anaerovorax odorimutans]MCQ4638197.1 pyridoxamine 5'-phosphate oxidase family protein [Anaerovorax odorimutans]
MRRQKQEIKEFEKMLQVLEKGQVCRIAFFDREYPYIVPLNYGVRTEDGQVYLYFHGAHVGKKRDLMKENNKVGFETDVEYGLVVDEEAGRGGMNYESIIGQGVLEEVTDQGERLRALDCIAAHYPLPENFKFCEAAKKAAKVLRLTVTKMTGKSRLTVRYSDQGWVYE